MEVSTTSSTKLQPLTSSVLESGSSILSANSSSTILDSSNLSTSGVHILVSSSIVHTSISIPPINTSILGIFTSTSVFDSLVL